MTKEDKELLLRDLCCRLPYGVKVAFEEDGELITDRVTMIGWPSDEFMLYEASEFFTIEEIKPYLRHKDSMIKEEQMTYRRLQRRVNMSEPNYIPMYEYFDTIKSLDYLYSIHVDAHDLIPKGLALEAPSDMYENLNR